MDVQTAFTAQDQIEILDDSAPRLEDYASPQDWYAALTAWMNEVTRKVEQLPAEPPRKPPIAHPNNNLWDSNIGRASFIVGCLALDGTILFDENNTESVFNFGCAVKAVAHLLRITEPNMNGDMNLLPIMLRFDATD